MSLFAGAARAAPPACARVPNLSRAAPIIPPGAAVSEIKQYLRIEGDAEDALIGRLAATAIGHCEAFTGQLLLVRQANDVMPATAEWRMLAQRPAKAITDVAVQTGVEASVPLAVDGHAVDIDTAGDGWVRVTQPQGGARIHVAYLAGLAEQWDEVPEPVRQGVIRLASHLYTHRDASSESDPPAAVAALWRPWRRMRLA
jgi:uncharacterized phiE125 gp8 family phage protein